MHPESDVPPGKGFLERAASPPETGVESPGDVGTRLDQLARTRLLVLDSTVEGIYQVDPEGYCTFMNRAACRMLGYWFGEPVGKKIEGLHRSRDFETDQADLLSASRQTLEDEFRRADGSTFPVEWSSHAVYENGIDRGTVVSFRDLTDRKAMEHRVNQSERSRSRLAALLDAATDFVGLVVDESANILSVSRAAEGMFGYVSSELIGRPFGTLIPEYERFLVENGWSADFASGELPKCPIRMRGRRRSGETIPLEVSLGECVEDSTRVIAAIVRDITNQALSEETLERQAEDLRRSEQALRHQTRLVNSIVTSMGDGVIAADENGDIVLYNPAAVKLLGEPVASSVMEPQAWIEAGYTIRLNETTPCPTEELPLIRAVRGQAVSELELLLHTPQRAEDFWIDTTAQPMIDDDGVLRGGVLVFRDVTDQKAAREALRRAKDEAEAANRAKSEFLSRMSHELRTPMNAILGFAQLLEDDPLSPDQQDAIARILKAARHLLGLINEVLDISRIEAGRLNFQIERLSVLDLIQSAVELVSPLAAKRKIVVLQPPSCDVHWRVDADRQALTQVLVNLLGNAIKYNREEGEVRLSVGEVTGSRLRITVIDTGFGIAPEQLKKLFIPFERLGAERSGIEGTGLGLAYSNRLVTAMGGNILVESEFGKGSRFSIDLPLPECEPGPQQLTAAPREAVKSAASAYRADCSSYAAPTVLCIQQDPASYRDIEGVFGRLPGYAVVSAERGKDGIQKALSQPPELIVLDLELPDMNGLEVLKELRRQASTRQIPIVVATAGLTEEKKRLVLDAGAHSCVAKPIEVRSFLDTIACLI